MKESTINLYNNVLSKINVNSILDLHDHDTIIARINALSSNSYKIMAYRAIHSIVDDPIYNKEYKQLVKMPLNTQPMTLPMTLSELLNIKIKCVEPLQELVEAFTVWINTHHPLRLDYYNVPINPPDKENHINYMTYSDSILTFYLNDFKNVKSFGPQVLIYSDPIICDYIQALTAYFGSIPKYLLYRYEAKNSLVNSKTDCLLPFSSRIMYGGYLQDLFKRHTGHHITMNIIRKIHESNLIQSEEYRTMSYSEKQKNHNLLLHSLQTAHCSYNII